MGFYPNRKEVVLLLQLMFVLGIFLHVKAYICEVGREKDDRNIWRWVLPYDNPCGCSRIIMRGMNTWTPIRPFKPIYVDSPLLSADIGEIRQHYGLECGASWSKWGKWSDCSATRCGSGVQNRDRECVDPYSTGVPCEGGLPYQSKTCINGQCPIWSDWGEWSSCSTTGCGNGTKNRDRECADPDSTGVQCEGGLSKESKTCNNGLCPSWSEWGEWSNCSTTSCGNGTTNRIRECVDPDSTGVQCEGGLSSESKTCINGQCPIWSDWGEWSSCSTTTCGNGTKNRARECADPDSTGVQCEGDLSKESKTCNNGQCPSWGEWGEWSSCSTTGCGNGIKTRASKCLDPDSTGVQCGGDLPSESEICNIGRCPSWSEWGVWRSCSRAAGTGNKKRTRECEDPDSTGVQCEGDQSSESKSCCRSFCPLFG